MGAKKGAVRQNERQFNDGISERIEELRKAHKVLHSELAKVAGVTQQTFGAYEAGVTRWPVFRVCLIARFFDVEIEELMPEIKHNIVFLPLQRKLP